MNKKTIPILLIMKNELYPGLLKALGNTKEYYCLSGQMAIAKAFMDEVQPELVFADYASMPGNGVYIIQSLTKIYPGAKCIGVTQRFSLALALDLENAGAKGYIWRTLGAAEQWNIVKEVYAGKTVIAKEEEAGWLRLG